MPLPLGIVGLASGFGGIAGLQSKIGLGGQRGRTPAQNRRMRQQQVRDAEAMARAGDQFGVDLLRAWLGELPSLSVARADYRSGVGQGRMPADGRALAQTALDALKADGVVTAAGRLTAHGKRASTEKRAKATEVSRETGARKGTATRGAARERTYVRYDPDTGERVLVTRDDPRYDEWTNRRPSARSARMRSTRTGARTSRSRRKTRSQREIDSAVRRITTEATKAGLNVTAAAARGFAGLAASAGLSVGAAAALVVGAGLVSYLATSKLIEVYELNNDPAYRRSQAALAYRKARGELEQRLYGRKGSPPGVLLEPVQHQFLAKMFRDALQNDTGFRWNPPER